MLFFAIAYDEFPKRDPTADEDRQFPLMLMRTARCAPLKPCPSGGAAPGSRSRKSGVDLWEERRIN
jgi:hypothetical protein